MRLRVLYLYQFALITYITHMWSVSFTAMGKHNEAYFGLELHIGVFKTLRNISLTLKYYAIYHTYVHTYTYAISISTLYAGGLVHQDPYCHLDQRFGVLNKLSDIARMEMFTYFCILRI